MRTGHSLANASNDSITQHTGAPPAEASECEQYPLPALPLAPTLSPSRPLKTTRPTQTWTWENNEAA
eukprot:1561107-Rhodomonas_salina.3